MCRPARRLAVVLLLLAGVGRPLAAGDPGVKAELEVIEKNAREPFEQDKRTAAIRRLGALGRLEGAQALVALMSDPFEHVPDHVVSAWIAMLKGPEAAAVQTFLAKDGLAHRDPHVRVGAATALGLTGGQELADAFRSALAREQDPTVLVALARAARSMRGGVLCPEAFVPHLAAADGAVVLAAAEVAAAAPDAAEAGLRRALQHKEPLARAGAVLGLQRIGRMSEADLARVWADKAPEPRMALAETLELRTALLPWPGAGQEAYGRLLTDPSWRVRAAGIDAGVRLWDPGVLPRLVERLAEEPGRLHGDAHQALRTLTGEELTDDPDLWRAWLTQKGASLDLGPRPEPDRFGRLRRPTSHTPVSGGQVETHTTAFFDLRLRSQRMVFVFDLSGSMGKPAKRDAADGSETKLDITRREFEKTLGALPESAALDLLVYRYPSGFPPKPQVTRALGRLQPLTSANRKKVADWLRVQNAKGWGAFFEALLAAAEEDVDTIVLLSDGVPSRGRYDRPQRLLDEWVRANRFRRVAVNTVLIGDRATDRELMQDLAWSTWGESSVAKPD